MGEGGDAARTRATLLGGLAILFWASGIAFIRTLSEDLGVFRACSYVYLGGGIAALLGAAIRNRGLGWVGQLSRRYLFACGILFVANAACVYTAVGLATSREAMLTAGLINYLWPSLMLLFSVPIQKNRARWTLLPGVAVALAGIVLVNASAGELSWNGFVSSLRANILPFGLALCAATSWALFSNLSCTWGARDAGRGVPLFLVATGLVLTATQLFAAWPAPKWSMARSAELAYMTLFPAALAYTFWDHAVRRGHFVLVVVLSYFTPLLSTAFSATRLHVHTSVWLWAGCLMVVGGAVLCKLSVRPAASPLQPPAQERFARAARPS